MSAPDQVALEHENWIGYLTGVAPCTSDAMIARDGGVVSILTSLSFDWMNQILIEADDATEAAVGAGVARARERGYPFVVRLRDGIDDRFIATLAAAGLTPAGEGTSTRAMVAFPIDMDAIGQPRATGLDIRGATDAQGIDDHRFVVGAGFGADLDFSRSTMCPDVFEKPGRVAYVGYADGAPVVSGLGWRTGRTIGIYSIATIPTARRRGYGTAITARVMADGVAAGCDAAALQASELGRPIYERLGFRTIITYTAFADPITRQR